jgi:hypothetical protein
MNKQDQFSEWYKEQFNKLNEEPPVDIWDNISDNLDIEDVWTKVDSKLDVIEKRKALAIRGLFVLSLLLLFFVIGNVFLNIYKYSSKMTSANLGKKSDKTHNSRSLNDNVTTFENRKTEKIKSNISSSSSSSSSKNLTTDLLVKKSSDMSNLPLSKVLSKSLSNGGVDTFSDKTINVLVKHVNQPSQTSNLPSSKVRVNTNNSNNSIDTSSDKLAKALVKQINQPSQINNLSLSKVHENNTTLNNHTDVSSGRAINALVKHGDQFGNIMGDPTNHVSKNTTDFNYTKVKNDSSLFVISPISTIPIPFKPIDSIVSNLEIPSMDESIYYVNPISKFHGFYAGGICSVNNVWLLNQLTFDGLKGNSLSDTKIGMGYSYGISVGYNIVSHWSGEVNWYINSKHGQTYNIYNEGRYTSREINMNYTIINLSFKHRNEGYNYRLHAPRSNNFVIGFNAGFLKNGENKSVYELNSLSEDIGISYYSNDYGLRIGYEYEIIAFKKLIISSALLGDIGLKNIYKGYTVLPGIGINNETYTASLGVNLGIKYLIK